MFDVSGSTSIPRLPSWSAVASPRDTAFERRWISERRWPHRLAPNRKRARRVAIRVPDCRRADDDSRHGRISAGVLFVSCMIDLIGMAREK